MTSKYPKVLNGKYTICKKIGSGAFGKVYVGQDIKTKQFVAIKTETIKEKNKNITSSLLRELKIYNKLAKESDAETLGTINGEYMINNVRVNVPKLYGFYKSKRKQISDTTYKYHQYLVMELLGPNLNKLFNKMDKHFPLINIYSMANQMIGLLEAIHNIGWLHRDLKPENFVIGLGRKGYKKVYLIDFGLSRRWGDMIDKYNSVLIDGQSSSSIVGTARYMSINVHNGKAYSWRDDLESLGYILIYFLRGQLPWQGFKEKNGKRLMRKIYKSKLENKKILCDNLPSEFKIYMNYCWSLKIDSQPDYSGLQRLFKNKFLELLNK
jgi:serine/threonine protein kinase